MEVSSQDLGSSQRQPASAAASASSVAAMLAARPRAPFGAPRHPRASAAATDVTRCYLIAAAAAIRRW